MEKSQLRWFGPLTTMPPECVLFQLGGNPGADPGHTKDKASQHAWKLLDISMKKLVLRSSSTLEQLEEDGWMGG